MSAIAPLLLRAGLVAAYAVEPEEIRVEETARPDLACQSYLDPTSLTVSTELSSQDLLGHIPGVHASSLGSQGLPDMLYTRGFDASFGRHLGVNVAGVPLNEPSGVRAHGMVDLHVLPVSLVRTIDTEGGSESPGSAPFGTSGTVHLDLGVSDEGWSLRLAGGSDGSGDIGVTWRPHDAPERTFVVTEVDGGEGFGQSRSWRHTRVAGGLDRNLGPVRWTTLVLLYDGEFQMPGLLREDDLNADEVTYFDAYQNADNGRSQRALATTRLTRPWRRGAFTAMTYAGYRRLRLESNRTGWAHDPVNGDGIEDLSRGVHAGMRLSLRHDLRWRRLDARMEGGFDLLTQRNHQSTTRVDTDGGAVDTAWNARVQQADVALWARSTVRIGRTVQMAPGVRLERFDLRVEDQRPQKVEAAPVRAGAWGPSPSVVVSINPDRPVRGFASWGRSYRPPEARSLFRDDRHTTERFDTTEAGVEVITDQGVRFGAVGFLTLTPSETLIDVLTRETLAQGRHWRHGVDGRVGLPIRERWNLAVDGSWMEARDRSTGDRLPLVPRWRGAATLNWHGHHVGRVGIDAAVSWRQVGRRPLPGGGHASTTYDLDAVVRAKVKRWTFDIRADRLPLPRTRAEERVYVSLFDPRHAGTGPTRHFVSGRATSLQLRFGLII